MPKQADELSAIQVKRIKEEGLHPVGGVAGLRLLVKAGGARSWILRTTIQGARVDVGLGAYPEVGVGEARDAAKATKASIKAGQDPRTKLTATKAVKQSFQACAVAYMDAHRPSWKNAKHAQQWENTLATYAFPRLGHMHVGAIAVADVLAVVQPIWTTKNETAVRLLNRIQLVLDYALALGYRPPGMNPAMWRGNLSQLLPKPSKVNNRQHHPALPHAQAREFLAALQSKVGTSIRCLEFVLLTACRSGEARLATWSEIDLDKATWSIPAARMKSGRAHRVPLSPEALALLTALPRLADCPLLFPGQKEGRPLSDMALTLVMRRMGTTDATGVQAVPHGLRSTFRDWAAEETHTPNDVVEMSLAHALTSGTEAAYKRTDLFDKRRGLMDAWAAHLSAKPATNVVAMRRAG